MNPLYKLGTQRFSKLIALSFLTTFAFIISPITTAYAGGGPSTVRLMGGGGFTDCGPGDHFDSGGAGANYSNSENFTETYCSSVAGDCIEFTFTSFDTESGFDDLTIHDGPNTGSPVIGVYDGTALPNGGTITSTSGCLTFVFSSDGSVVRTGWAASYTCVPCPAPTCSDGIQNQGETGIDCGGPCPPCSSNHNIGTGNFTTCSGNIFDSGGSGGAYSNSENFTETYCSSTPGDCISINFSSFATESCCDHLNIYDGPNTSSPLIGTFNGTNSPGTVTATGGCLTFQWTSDGSVTAAGWQASISCSTCPTCNDGILNGLEIGVDCGGPVCPACPCSSLPVSNDEACCATPVTVNPDQNCGSVTSGTVQNATPSFNANTCFGTDDDDVWFSFVATNTTHYIDLLNITGSVTDMYHAVYGGTCSATGASLICNDLNSSILGGLTVGNTYFIRVYTYTATGGQNTTFDVCVGSPPPPPTNDDPCSATPAVVNPDVTCNLTTPGYCVGATQSQTGCVGTADDDVWFSFVALSTEQDVTIQNATGTTDMVHEVFSQGNNCNNLTSLGCSDPNTSSYSGLTVGDTYYVRVYTYSATGNNTSFDLCINSPCGIASTPPDCGLNYSHSSIAYNPVGYNQGTAITFSDDRYANAFTSIGFDFCFDGIYYQDVMVSSNGYLIFPGCYSSHNGNDVVPGGYSPYSISAAVPNATNAPQNAIMGPWQDIDPSISGSVIRTNVHGTAPNRVFVAKFSTVGMFSCTTMDFTGQIMLYETTNDIEVHLGEKTTCTTFNSGAAILGLNNYDGTIGVVPGGYNYPTQWSVPTNSPEGHRFTEACATCVILLPVDLLSFDATAEKLGNQLNWVTTSETDNDYFVVEKSTNGVSFVALGVVDGAGNSTTEKAYQYFDNNINPGVVYYRLRQVRFDGTAAYSKIIALTRGDQTTTVNVFPNPSTSDIVTVVASGDDEIQGVSLTNYLGQSTRVDVDIITKTELKLNVAGLAKGTYIVEVKFENSQSIFKKLILK